MLTPRDLLLGVALPAIVAALVAILARWILPRDATGATRVDGVGALSVAAGVVASYLALFGWPGFPPLDATDWLPYFAPAAAAFVITQSCWRFVPFVAEAPRLAFTAFAVYLLLHPVLTAAAGARLGLSLAIALAAQWLLLDRLAEKSRTAALPGTIFAVSAAVSVAVLLSGSFKLAQFGGLSTASIAAIVLVAWWFSDSRMWRDAVPFFVVLIGGVVLSGHWYANLTATNAALLAVAPALSAIGLVPAVARRDRWQRIVIELAVVLVPCGVAIALAARDFVAAMSGPSSYY